MGQRENTLQHSVWGSFTFTEVLILWEGKVCHGYFSRSCRSKKIKEGKRHNEFYLTPRAHQDENSYQLHPTRQHLEFHRS